MQLIVLFLLAYALKAAWEDARKGWRTSKSAYMRSADARFPRMPRSRRAAHALRHDAGYWAAQALHGFPTARHGLAYGWHAGRMEQAERRAGREQAKAERLEAEAILAPHVAGYRERQQAARQAAREAGRAGSRGTVRERIVDDVPEGAGLTFPRIMRARSRAGRPVNPLNGDPYDVITVYGPDDLRRRTEAAAADPDIEITTEPLPDLSDPDDGMTWTAETTATEPAGDCYLCGLPLTAVDSGGVHQRCEEAYERDCAENEVRDDRDLDEVERDLREQGRCPWQINPAGWEGGAVYCGQPITDTGGDLPDLFCLQHQAEADGDDEGAAQELNEHVQAILWRDAQPERLAITQGGALMAEERVTGTTASSNAYVREYGAVARNAGGTVPASDVTYDGVISAMSAAVARAEGSAAEQQQAGQQASAMADQAQALGVDPATLSAMADHLDAHDAATRALQRVQETAETVRAELQRGHAGLAEAHANAPVAAADRQFYEQ